MKLFAISLIILIQTLVVYLPGAMGQSNAQFGYSLPPHPVDSQSEAVVKALVVFAEKTQNFDQQGLVNGYGYTSLPAHASSYFDFSYDTSQTPVGTLTKYFWEASFGKMVLLADYLDHKVQVSSGGGYTPIFNYIDSLYTKGILQSKLAGNSAPSGARL